MTARAPIETKAVAAIGGGVGGGSVAVFLLWLLGCGLWGVPWDAAHADDAILAVPLPVIGIVGLILTGAGPFIAAYLAPHTMRTEEVGQMVAVLTGHKPEET